MAQEHGSHPHASPEALFTLFRDMQDEAAFEALYKRFERPMYAKAVRCFRGRFGDGLAVEMACDAVQDTWLKVYRRRDDWKEGRSFASWLWVIHSCIIIDAFRRKRRTEANEEPLGDDLDTDVLAWAVAGEDKESELLTRDQRQWFIQGVMEKLRPADREVLQVAARAPSGQQAAQELGIGNAALRQRLRRARVRFHNVCAGDPELRQLVEELGLAPLLQEERA